MHLAQLLVDLGSGGLVGFVLGLVGGGGSILAVPLMLYAVGVPSAHVAVGTSAVAVAANAAAGLVGQARRGLVDWRCGGLFALGGVGGALLGAQAGKLLDGGRLMLLFAVLMLAVAAAMLLRGDRNAAGEGDAARGATTSRLLGTGAGTGILSGFFGIGGGFLIVPGLMGVGRMPAQRACATSLLAVSAFGLTTAASYAWSGLVSWPLAALFIAGGTGGMAFGTRASGRLASGQRLVPVLAVMISATALYILLHGLHGGRTT